MSEPDPGLRGYFAKNVSKILESGAIRFPVAPEILKILIAYNDAFSLLIAGKNSLDLRVFSV